MLGRQRGIRLRRNPKQAAGLSGYWSQSQNHGVVGVGRDLWKPPCPTPLLKQKQVAEDCTKQHRGKRNGNCGQSLHICLCRSFVLREETPHTLPVPPWGPSHGRESSMNFNMHPSLGLQFFMNCSIVGHKSCQQTCSRGAPLSSDFPQMLPGAPFSTGFPRGHSLL